MGKCINHPEHETSYICMKHRIYLCQECLQCKDPEIYCKFRPSCPIGFISKRKADLDREEEETALAGPTGTPHPQQRREEGAPFQLSLE